MVKFLFAAIACVSLALGFFSPAPAHQRCTAEQLGAIARAGGTLRPDTCDNLRNYMAAYPTQTWLGDIAGYEQMRD